MNNCVMCTKWDDEPGQRIAELECCYLTLNSDQFFPGYCFLFSKVHVTELFHLQAALRGQIIEEVSRVAAALQRAFEPTKINYELLGNMVPHMHWHLVPRFATDPLWPRPIWSEPHEPLTLTGTETAARITLIQKQLEHI